jgi:predicted small lipoprotein YifL
VSRRRLRLAFAVLGALAAALSLAGCGRKGPLDPPPAAAPPPPQAAAPAAGVSAGAGTTSSQAFDSNGQPVAPKGPKKHLPIDWLLN